MKERRGAIARATGLAEGVAAAVRRRQREREPRLLLYDAAGHPRLLQPDARGYGRILEVCEQMVAVVEEAERPAPAQGE